MCEDGARSSQACNDEGMAYLPCNCQPSAGSAGKSPNGQTGAQPSGGGSPGGSPGGSSGSTDTNGGAAGTDGGPQGGAAQGGQTSGDDPCPIVGNLVDCSGSCENPSQCHVSQCMAAPDYDSVLIDSVPAVVRTPSAPGDRNCKACPSGGLSAVANITIRTTLIGSYKFEVDPPWYVQPGGGHSANSLCVGNQCLAWGLPVVIATTDPNAPSRNVRITEGESCP